MKNKNNIRFMVQMANAEGTPMVEIDSATFGDKPPTFDRLMEKIVELFHTAEGSPNTDEHAKSITLTCQVQCRNQLELENAMRLNSENGVLILSTHTTSMDASSSSLPFDEAGSENYSEKSPNDSKLFKESHEEKKEEEGKDAEESTRDMVFSRPRCMTMHQPSLLIAAVETSCVSSRDVPEDGGAINNKFPSTAVEKGYESECLSSSSKSKDASFLVGHFAAFDCNSMNKSPPAVSTLFSQQISQQKVMDSKKSQPPVFWNSYAQSVVSKAFKTDSEMPNDSSAPHELSPANAAAAAAQSGINDKHITIDINNAFSVTQDAAAFSNAKGGTNRKELKYVDSDSSWCEQSESTTSGSPKKRTVTKRTHSRKDSFHSSAHVSDKGLTSTTSAERKLLKAVFDLSTTSGLKDVSKTQVALFAGYQDSKRPGFVKIIGVVKKKKFITANQSTVSLTPIGIAALEALHISPTKLTNENAHSCIKEFLTPSTRRIFDTLSHGEPVSRVKLARKHGYENDQTPGFRKVLSTMKKLGIIHYSSDVQLTDLAFPFGRNVITL